MNVRVVAAVAMFGAAALWGTSGGVIAGLDVSGAAAAAVLELVTGVLLTVVARMRGLRLLVVVRALGWRLPLLGVVEAVNVVCYFESLQLAPVGPAMAIHLTAPVILSIVLVATGGRALNARTAGSFALVCVALLLLASEGGGAAYPHVVLGLVLSFVSAVCLALFITLVSRAANDVPPMAAAGAQMLVSGIVMSPALLLVDKSEVLPLTLLALTLFAPACWLYWVAMRRLSPITGGTILLAEPFFGTLSAYAVHELGLAPLHAVAAALVLLATYLDLTAPTMAPDRRVDVVE